MPESDTSDPILTRALRGEEISHTPVWFMRQAGSHFPEHRELFEKHGVRGITTNPELNTRETTLPVEKLDVDGAVMYADIILPLEDMGIDFHYGEGEKGPIIHNPIETVEDVENLRILDPERGVPYILETIGAVKNELPEEKALIGFSGGPFTLAGYIVEGQASRNFPVTKQFMHTHPEAFHSLMQLLTDSIITYLEAQARAGIDVIQLFDSWIGVLSPADYRDFVLPYHRTIFKNLKSLDQPTIQFGTQTAGFIKDYVSSGADAVSVDWRIDLDTLARQVGTNHIVQGNLDPAMLFAPEKTLKKEVEDILEAGKQFDAHIFNLGHRIPLNAKPETLKTVVDHVHKGTWI